MTYTPKTKEWFLARLNKRIYRDKNGCDCISCKQVEEHGLIVIDEHDAEYLATIDKDSASEGIYLNYRDNK